MTNIQLVMHCENISWDISDQTGQVIISGDLFNMEDDISIELKSDMRYFLNVSLEEPWRCDTSLLTLYMSDLPLLVVSNYADPGDYSIPFFTGYHPGLLKIIGGTNADIADFPWQVYFAAGNYLCGGSIIGDDWIVTAAHCTQDDDNIDIPASSMHIKAGATNRNSSAEGEIYDVEEVYRHESYDSETYLNDIALLKLETPIDVENASPIHLVSEEDANQGATDPGVMSTVTGWGLINVDPKIYPDYLQKVDLPIVSSQAASSVWGTIPESVLMAGYLVASKDACSGDSGGPLVVPTINGKKLAGIVSWGDSNCSTYGGYTRISSFLDWIEEKSGIKTNFKPGKPAGDSLVCQGTPSTIYSIEQVPSSTTYEWNVQPGEAIESISSDNEIAEVFWNSDFLGDVSLFVRVTFDDDTSDYSIADIQVVQVTDVISQSADTIVCEEIDLGLEVQVAGYEPDYQWFRDGDTIPWERKSSYVISGTDSEQSGIYHCNVSTICGDDRSEDITVEIRENTAVNSVSPETQVSFGSQAILEVDASGYDLSYTWEQEGEILEGEESPLLSLPDVDARSTGNYRSTVTGYCGQVISDWIYLYVIPDQDGKNIHASVWPTIPSETVNIALENGEEYEIKLYNSSGTRLLHLTGQYYKTVIPVSDLGAGFYMIRILSEGVDESYKILIQ